MLLRLGAASQDAAVDAATEDDQSPRPARSAPPQPALPRTVEGSTKSDPLGRAELA